MPNWVKNIVEFETNSDRINQIVDTIKSEEDGDVKYFDFEKILPMPESLKISSGSSTDLGIDILKYQERGDDSSLKERLEHPWVTKAGLTTVDELVDYCLKEGNADLESARKALFNIDNYDEYDAFQACEVWGYDPAEVFPEEYRDRRIKGLLD